MYGMKNYGKLFSDELRYWLLEAGFVQSQCQMSIYYKYVIDGTIIIVFSNVNECVYWYNYEALV